MTPLERVPIAAMGSHREVAVGRDGDDDSVRADTTDGTATYLYGAEGEPCVTECRAELADEAIFRVARA